MVLANFPSQTFSWCLTAFNLITDQCCCDLTFSSFMHVKLTVPAQTSFPTFQIQNIPSLLAHYPSSTFQISLLPPHSQRGVRRLHSRRLQFSSLLR